MDAGGIDNARSVLGQRGGSHASSPSNHSGHAGA